MLIQFTVENFMSFRKQTIFNLKPSISNELKENIVKNEKHQAVKTAVVFGANASGKSNVIKAVTAAIMMLRESEQMQIDMPLQRIVPFKLGNNTMEKPTFFEFVFVTDGIKYIYGFSATVKKIHKEYLYAYYSNKPTTVFQRDGDKYEFKRDKSELMLLSEKNISNKLFLSTATAWNYKETKAPYRWFSTMVDTYDKTSWQPDFQSLMDEKQKRFTKELLRIADINIADYHVNKTEMPKEQVEAIKLDPVLKSLMGDGNFFKGDYFSAATMHEVQEDSGDISMRELDLMEESTGTQTLFFMSTKLKEAFETGKIMVIDEIEAGLHPLIVEEIVRMFNDDNINRKNAQLIFTTHDTNILNLDLLRRDQIFFIEKNRMTAESELYALSDFSVRKTENIRNAYMHGRYGAVPNVLIGNMLWE